MRRGVATGLLVLLAVSAATAQDPNSASRAASPEEQKKRAVEAVMRRHQPGENHRRLAPLVGTWEAKWKVWHQPNTKPADEATGTATFEWTQDGRFIRGTYEGDGIMGRPFTGELILGYNASHGHYELVWINSFETSVTRYEGQPKLDAKGNFEGIELRGQADNCATGQKSVAYRSVWRIVDDNTLLEEVFGPDRSGKEFKATEVVYKRASKAASLAAGN